MKLRTLCLLIVSVAPMAAAAQESFPATHIARLDIVDPLPSAGTIGGVAIVAVSEATGTAQVRVSAAPAGDMPDSLLLVRRTDGGGDIVLGGIPFPPNATTVTTTLPGFIGPALTLLDSGMLWFRVTTRSNHALYVEGPIVDIPSAIAPEPSGTEVVPRVDSTDGVGHCGLAYDAAANSFSVKAWWLDLSGPATAARIRRAPLGSNGPIVFEMPLTSGSDQYIGTWAKPSAELRTALLNNELYLEITSAKFPNGELRGQIYPVEGFTAAIESGNETPAVTGSTASGSAYLLITAHGTIEAFNKLQGVVGNLNGPISAAHIHRAPIGQNGGPAVSLEIPTPTTIDLELATGSAGGTIADAIVQDIRATGTYVNVHTAAHQSGEARGQLIPARTRIVAPIGGVEATDGSANLFSARWTPASGEIAFDIGLQARTRRILLHDVLGRVARTTSCDGMAATIPAAGLPAGTYFARLLEENGNISATCRVMITP